MLFYNYPRKQSIYIAYTHNKLVQSKLFDALYIQISKKDSIVYRLLKSPLRQLFQKLSTNYIEVPHKGQYICLIKPDQNILFEFENNDPINVWRKDITNNWNKEKFIGYPLVQDYSLEEFNNKLPVIEKALSTHWEKINSNPSKIHGDFTHFNILVDSSSKEIHFIDKKSNMHSKIFDFFYFYYYYIYCLEACTTTSSKNKTIIRNKLSYLLKSICIYPDIKQLDIELQTMNLPKKNGLKNFNLTKKIEEFRSIFYVV